MRLLLINIIAVFFIITLSGCAKSQAQPTIVKMPIPVAPSKLTIPILPKLPIEDLDDNSSAAEVIKAYVASIQLLKNYIIARDLIDQAID